MNKRPSEAKDGQETPETTPRSKECRLIKSVQFGNVQAETRSKKEDGISSSTEGLAELSLNCLLTTEPSQI